MTKKEVNEQKTQQTWRWRNELEDFRSTTNPLISDKSSDNFPEDTGGKVTDEHRFQVTSLTGPLNGSMIHFIAPVNNFLLGLFRGRRPRRGADLRAPKLAAGVRRGVEAEPGFFFNHGGLSPHLSTERVRERKKYIHIYMNGKTNKQTEPY